MGHDSPGDDSNYAVFNAPGAGQLGWAGATMMYGAGSSESGGGSSAGLDVQGLKAMGLTDDQINSLAGMDPGSFASLGVAVANNVAIQAAGKQAINVNFGITGGTGAPVGTLGAVVGGFNSDTGTASQNVGGSVPQGNTATGGGAGYVVGLGLVGSSGAQSSSTSFLAVAGEAGGTATASTLGSVALAASPFLLLSGDTYTDPNVVTFRRYDYASNAGAYSTVGIINPKTFAAPLTDPVLSAQKAQSVYALPGSPRDSYYLLTVNINDNPYIGPTTVTPNFGQPGGGNEVIILGPIPPTGIRGPYPLPQSPVAH